MKKTLQLPTNLVSTTELFRVNKELGSLNTTLHQDHLKQPEHKPALPKLSAILEELAKLNDCDLLDETERASLQTLLEELSKNPVVVNISFSADPSPKFLSKIVQWFREQSGHPVLLHVGLQPSIAAGCIIRTANKYFDLSLRQTLLKNQTQLADLIRSTHAE